MTPEQRAAMQLALAALRMSSPHTDANYGWKEPDWAKQRAEAIEALEEALKPLMKFRQHRGSLADSMETMVEIPATMEALKAEIERIYPEWAIGEEDIIVKPYGEDRRIGWNTHIILVEGRGVVGFTDTGRLLP